MKHFLSIESLSGEVLARLIEQGLQLKASRGSHQEQPLLGQTWAMIFMKSSTRTRVSFEVGIRELGGQVMFLSANDLQLGRGEPIEDTARVLGRMVHGVVLRNDSQRELEVFAEKSGIPTINALTDVEHPCQIVSDLMTIQERLRPSWAGLRIAFLGDGACNVATSWIWAAVLLGFELVIAAPPSFQPEQALLAKAQAAGGRVMLEPDPQQAVVGCEVLYTDVWVSMGREAESADRIELMRPYQVNESLVRATGRQSIVMHCLPAYRGMEITETVLEEHAEVIFDQAENRLHGQKAVLCHSALRV